MFIIPVTYTMMRVKQIAKEPIKRVNSLVFLWKLRALSLGTFSISTFKLKNVDFQF